MIDISKGRQLFVDDFLIQQTDLEPEYHKAEKFYGNPVLFLRTPGWKNPAVIGVSADGINFTDLSFTGIVGDRSTAFYNPFRKKWVYSVRSQFWDGAFERSRIY